MTRVRTQQELDDLPSVVVSLSQIDRDIRLSEVAVEMGFAHSVNEGKRAIDEGSVYLNNIPIVYDWKIRKGWFRGEMTVVLSVGPKRDGVIKLGA